MTVINAASLSIVKHQRILEWSHVRHHKRYVNYYSLYLDIRIVTQGCTAAGLMSTSCSLAYVVKPYILFVRAVNQAWIAC